VNHWLPTTGNSAGRFQVFILQCSTTGEAT
jgi:hypothetical protein